MTSAAPSTKADSVVIRQLTFDYGEASFRLAIDELRVGDGERVALIGPSGCGKTTLLHLIAGILIPGAGSIEVVGQSLHTFGDGRRRAFRITSVGMVFQEFELLEHLSVRENILLPYYIHGALTLDPAAEAQVRRLAEHTGITDYLARYPRNLSQGERQRVAVCRALIASPAILLADEPTGNLDPESGRAVLDLIDEEVESRGCSAVVVTHDHSLLERFDRVLDLRDFARRAET